MPNIILAVTGGIAAYKAADLASVLSNEPGYCVQVVMTESAKKFITSLTLAVLSKSPVYDDASEWTSDGTIKHIDLAKWCDLFVVVPATANTIAKMAQGIADNLLTSTYLALPKDKKVLICPAMNTKMWEASVTQNNISSIKCDGDMSAQITDTTDRRVLPPEEGLLACGDIGVGKLPSTRRIVEEIKMILKGWVTNARSY